MAIRQSYSRQPRQRMACGYCAIWIQLVPRCKQFQVKAGSARQTPKHLLRVLRHARGFGKVTLKNGVRGYLHGDLVVGPIVLARREVTMPSPSACGRVAVAKQAENRRGDHAG